MAGNTAATVLVTGATGFVGRPLVDLLLANGHRVAAASVAGDRLLETLPEGVEGLAFDILDGDAVAEALGRLQPAAIFHLAGLARGGDLQRLLSVNVMGTETVLRAAHGMASPPTVILPGSAAEYGALPHGEPAQETAPLRPLSPYGVSKVAQTLTALGYAWRHEVPVVVGRVFNITGPGEPATMLVGAIAEQVAAIEAGRRDPVLRVGNLDPYRDYLDIRDAVRALYALWQAGTPGEIYNVCSGAAIQVRSVVERLVAQSRVAISVEPDPERQRPSDLPYCVGVPARIRSATGWRPTLGLEVSLGAALDWWRSSKQQSGRGPS